MGDRSYKGRPKTVPGDLLLTGKGEVDLGNVVKIDEWERPVNIDGGVVRNFIILSNCSVNWSDAKKRNRQNAVEHR